MIPSASYSRTQTAKEFGCPRHSCDRPVECTKECAYVKVVIPVPTTLLGAQSAIPKNPEEARLEFVPNPVPMRQDQTNDYFARFTCPEFTSLCPVTGQPDFAHIVIDYIPRILLVESKSLKLFLFSFRNHGAFHEACTFQIYERFRECDPKWLRVAAYWYPRGGIPIDCFFECGELPEGKSPPHLDVPSYRGRG